MATTTPSKRAYNKRYYQTHPKERKKLIDNQLRKQKANPKKYAKIQRERYHNDKDYRDYKIAYAREYYRRHKKEK